eukprot:scaffold1034_cov127-Cylindrotheca_fusiformis.AAC.9
MKLKQLLEGLKRYTDTTSFIELIEMRVQHLRCTIARLKWKRTVLVDRTGSPPRYSKSHSEASIERMSGFKRIDGTLDNTLKDTLDKLGTLECKFWEKGIYVQYESKYREVSCNSKDEADQAVRALLYAVIEGLTCRKLRLP